MSAGGVRAVFLDVGETLVDETRVWESWADWLGVPRFTFLAALGGIIERGEHHLQVFELFRPGFDLDEVALGSDHFLQITSRIVRSAL